MINTMPASKRITAIFATMGRPALAAGCVRAMAGQTRPPDTVIVAMNDPADGTRAAIERLGNLPFPIRILAMPENLGNAGGVAAAAELALDDGADWVWILDDDSWPKPEALAVLLDAGRAGEGNRIYHPRQIDPATGDLTWPVMLKAAEGNDLLVMHAGDMPLDPVIETRPAWTGALFPARAMREAGPIPGEWFIRGEDEDYPARVAACGWSFYLVPSAELEHPGPPVLHHESWLGRHFFWEPELPAWKLYYKVRNMVCLRRRESMARAAVAILWSVVASLRHDAMDAARWQVLIRAAHDGWCGHLGRADTPD